MTLARCGGDDSPWFVPGADALASFDCEGAGCPPTGDAPASTCPDKCLPDDGCCPAGCDERSDPDCATSPPVCGDGRVEGQETCDPPSACPKTCDDGDPCTDDGALGAAATCDVQCTHAAVALCVAGDGCCPAACSGLVDPDCDASCGNGERETGETCDPPESCPTDCDDGDLCTVDRLGGSAAACTAVCRSTPLTTCRDGDGCCPEGCAPDKDDDCGGGGVDCRRAASWPADWALLEEQVVEEMNAYRAAGATCVHDGVTTDYGPASPVRLEPAAREAGRCHSMDMGEMASMTHQGSDGSQFWTRMTRAGYTGSPLAENVAAGYLGAAAVTEGWMGSHDGHCNAIMDASANEVGVGYVYLPGPSFYDHWWTADFGIR